MREPYGCANVGFPQRSDEYRIMKIRIGIPNFHDAIFYGERRDLDAPDVTVVVYGINEAGVAGACFF